MASEPPVFYVRREENKAILRVRNVFIAIEPGCQNLVIRPELSPVASEPR